MTPEQELDAFEAWLKKDYNYDDLNSFEINMARYPWQAALAAPEVQALRKDAERYRKLVADWFDHVHGREFELMNDMPPESYQSKADIDEEIDKTMEKQK